MCLPFDGAHVYSLKGVMFLKFKDILKNNPLCFIILFCSVAVSGITFFYSHTVGIIELVLVAFLSTAQIYWFNNTVRRKSEEVKLLNSVMTEKGETGSELRGFPFPVVLLNGDGKIVWYNDLFQRVISCYPAYDGMNISSVLPAFDMEKVQSEGYSFEAESSKLKFTVYSSTLDGGLVALYFVDDTVLKDTRERYLLTRPAVLLINIDSLEQAEDELEHEDYFALNAEVDRMITKWLVEHNCFFRKFTDGKFAAVTEKENLDKMISERFDILDKVRDFHFIPEETDITLSIGVGCEKTFRECEFDAREALDMARGRGGDQAALSDNGDYRFFGGLKTGKEKRGKIKSRSFSATLDELIQNSSNVLIMGHNFGDFDCIGAAVGVAAMARSREKSVHIAVNKKRTLAAKQIEMVETERPDLFVSPEKAIDKAGADTLLVITDTMRADIVECPELLQKKLRTVIIDHHRMIVDHITGATLVFLEPNVSSACEIVTELVQYSPSKTKLTPIEAQALLAGIMLDTKDYTLRAGVRTFQAAAFLRDCKADPVTVRKLFAGTAEENAEVGALVASAEMFGSCAVAVTEKQDGSVRLVCSKAADELLTISGVDASFVIYPLGDKVSISARSYGRVNVQLIMEKLGGGGHLSMAAAQLTVTVKDAKKMLLDAINEYNEEQNNR